MRLVKKLAVVLITIIFFIFLLCLLWVWRYQKLVDEGGIIADKQCLDVNPLIIKRKQSYIKTIQIAKAGGSMEEYWPEQMNYVDISKKFIAAQGKWLKEDKAFIDRWDFRLLFPRVIQSASAAQYTMRDADMKSTEAVVKMFQVLDKEQEQKKLYQIIMDQTKRQDEASRQLEAVYATSFKPHLLYRFLKPAKSKCPAENLNIPDVRDFLAPPQETGHGPVS